jgi:hypothetical protein
VQSPYTLRYKGKFLKLWIGGDGLTSLSNPTTGSVVTPQAFATGAITVGAVNGSDGVGSHIEPFSSLGPVKIAFPAMKSIQAPVLVAPAAHPEIADSPLQYRAPAHGTGSRCSRSAAHQS